MKRAKLVGLVCTRCRKVVGKGKGRWVGDYAFHITGRGGAGHVFDFDLVDEAAESRPRPRPRRSPRRDRARRKAGHLALTGGGRPLAFIPALVIEHAAKLRRAGRGWQDILDDLERSGNGRYPRNTLKPRVVEVLDGGNVRELAGGRGAAAAPRARAESIRPRGGGAGDPDDLVVMPWDEPLAARGGR